MSNIYTNYTIVSGNGCGNTELTAFDNALLQAGVGDLNLVRVSSILPPLCNNKEKIGVSKGSILHIAYASITSSKTGGICSAIGIAIPKDVGRNGVIMEYSMKADAFSTELEQNCRNEIQKMLEESFFYRNLEMKEMNIVSSIAEISETSHYCCTFAGVALW